MPSLNFSVSAIADASLGQRGDLLDRVSSFESIIAARLASVLTTVRVGDPNGFDLEYKDKSALDITFAAIEDHVPKMMLRYFMVTVRSNGLIGVDPRRHDCPGECPDGWAYGALGIHEAVDREIIAHHAIWKQLGPENAVRHLVETEVLDRPDSVVAPIAVLRITDAGSEWLNPGMCEVPSVAIGKRISKKKPAKK